MLVLDTDHLTAYQKGTSPEAHRLKQRLDDSTESYATTIISVEEIMRGWMAAIRRIQDPRRQISSKKRGQVLSKKRGQVLNYDFLENEILPSFN